MLKARFDSSFLSQVCLQIQRIPGRIGKMNLNSPREQEQATKLSLIGVFLAVFMTFASLLSDRSQERRLKSMKPFDLILLSFSTYRLGRLVAFDKVFEPIRKPVTVTKLDETGAGKTVEPKGEGLQRSLGELISCPICAGTWIAAGLVYGLQILPNPTRLFLWMTSTIGAAELLNSLTEAFSWLGQAARKEAGNGQ
jgi:hypothetical protein